MFYKTAMKNYKPKFRKRTFKLRAGCCTRASAKILHVIIVVSIVIIDYLSSKQHRNTQTSKQTNTGKKKQRKNG
jgi:hypothetical protein